MKKVLFLLILFFSISFAQGQQTSTRGKEFWMTFMENVATNPVTLSIHFSAFQASVVTITNPNTTFTQTYNVAANTLVSVTLPNAQCLNTGSGTIANLVLKITATTEITMYALDYSPYTTDGSVILPVGALGVNYRVISYKGVSGYSSEFCVVATRDTTLVKITPTCNTLDGKVKNVPYFVTLNKGQSYQVQSNTDSSLTGSKVEVQNCKPVAVFGGSVCSNVPTTCQYCDHLYEQLYPINMWGKEYVVVPTATRNFDRLMVLTDQANTQVTINGVTTGIPIAGSSIESDINTPRYISANKPICVALFAEGQVCAGGNGDPMMMWVTPLEQGIDSIIFVAQNSSVIDSHYVNIVAKTSALGTIKLNGTSIGGSFSTVPANTNYAYLKKKINAGTNTITSDSDFTAYAYGYGNFESYGYNVGSSTRDLNRFFTVNGIISDNYSFPNKAMKFCKTTTLTFNGNSGSYTPIFWHWKFNNDTATTQNVTKTFADTGLVKVLMITAWVGTNLCSPNDTTLDSATMYIRIIGPVINILTPDTAVCQGSSFRVRVSYAGDTIVSWNSNPALSCTQCFTPIITPTTSGWYKANIGGSLAGCIFSDSIYVRILDSIIVGAVNDTIACKGSTIQVRARLLNKDTAASYIYKLYANNVFIRQDTAAYFDLLADTIRTYVIKINNGCYDAPSPAVTVFVRNPLHVLFTDSMLICNNLNNNFTFKLSGGDSTYTTYLLQNNLKVDSILNAVPNTNYNFNFTPNPLNIYRIVLKDGCTPLNDTVNLHFKYRLPLSSTHTSDTTACKSIFNLHITPYGGDSTYTLYLLKNFIPSDSVLNAAYGNAYYFSINLTTSSAYQLIVKDGCTILNDTQTVNVNVRNALAIAVSYNATICRGQSINIQAIPSGGDSTYSIYLLDNNLVIDSVKNAVINGNYNFTKLPSLTSSYKLVLSDGCTLLNDTLAVPFNFRNALSFLHTPDTSVCIAPLGLRITPSGGDSSYTIYLFKNSILADSINNAAAGANYYFNINPATNTSYKILLKDGCTILNDTQTIQVNVRQPLSFTHSPDTTICINQYNIQMTPFGGDSSYTLYLLNNNIRIDSVLNATNGITYNFSVLPTTNTTYKLVLTDGCTLLSDTQQVTINVRSALSLTHSTDTLVCIRPFSLRVTPSGGGGIYDIYLIQNNIAIDSFKNVLFNNNYIFNLTPTTTTTYKIVLKDGCTLVNDTQLFTLQMRAPLSNTISNSTIICRGQNLNITTIPRGGDSTYTLYLLKNSIVTDSILNAIHASTYNFNFIPTLNSIYKIVAIDACTDLNDTQTVVFNFRNALNFSHTSNQTICIGRFATIQINPAGGDSTYDIYLLKNNIVIDSTIGASFNNTYSFSVNPLITTTYKLVLKDGCTILNDTQSTTIFVRNALKATLGKDTIICRGQTYATPVSASGGDSTYTLYLMQGNIALDSIKNANNLILYKFNVTPTIKTTYKIVLKDGCTLKNDSGYITVDLHPAIVAKAITSKPKICFKDTATLTASATGGKVNPTYTYLWNNSSGNTSIVKVSPAVSTWYKVQASDGCSTPAFDSVYVEVEALPVVDFSAANTSGCEPFNTDFNNNSTATGSMTYRWNFGDGTAIETSQFPNHTFVKPGSYTVTLVVTSAFGCIDSMVLNNYIVVNPNPQVTLKISPKKVKLNDGKITFKNVFKFTDDYDIDFGDGQSKLTEPFTNNIFAHIYTDTGYFVVKLSAHNNFGCTTDITDTLYIEDYYTVFIPNIFSPNNKDGVNDYFRPVSTFTKQYDMVIYDRWGNFVYSETCKDKWYNCKGWDGTVNGRPVQEEGYIYIITLYEEDGQHHYIKGSVIIAK